MYCCNFSFSQNAESEHNDYTIGVGLYVGEGSGIALLKPISNQFMIQWNIGINELFVDYNFLSKYTRSRISQSYVNIFNSSLGLTFHKPITGESPISYRISLGGQLRVIPIYGFQPFIENPPPGTIYINDPIKRTELDFGIDYYVGVSYRFKKLPVAKARLRFLPWKNEKSLQLTPHSTLDTTLVWDLVIATVAYPPRIFQIT